jgi:NTE family protein
MRNYSIFLLLFFLIYQNQKVVGQVQKKPKIAVVLSGGGAKGIAHIPLLQKLDSLNIVPDLVVGTSMGSLVGGFYAMGYSGDSIASITKNANWDKLLGGKTSLRDVSVEEKSEFGKYLVDFHIKKGKIKTKVSILNDQHLREFFMVYTNPVYNVADFEQLPIPYRAIATDIVNGEEVVLKEGSLALAMRASMSIPSIFEPVPYNDVLLVDGGILNNFPVDVAKNGVLILL